MIKHFCEKCDREIGVHCTGKNVITSIPLQTFDGCKGKLKLTIDFKVDRHHTWTSGELCLECALRTINKAWNPKWPKEEDKKVEEDISDYTAYDALMDAKELLSSWLYATPEEQNRPNHIVRACQLLHHVTLETSASKDLDTPVEDTDEESD